MKKKCLITGGAGFIGSNLADYLVHNGYDVKIIDNFSTGTLHNLKNLTNKIELKKIDITNLKKLTNEFKGIDVVYHLAGLADIVPSIDNPVKYYETNVTGTLNVLQAARKYKINKLIYAASASCYGIPKKFPTNEKSPIDINYPYALTKFLGEQLVLNWAKVYKMNNVSIRFFNVYGPRSRTTGAYGAVFGVFLAQRLSKNPLTIVGDGKQTRDFIHVFDLVNAIEKASRLGKKGTVYNLASGKETTINYIANLIGGKKIYIPMRPGEPNRSLADISKIKKDLKWKPTISIDKGVKMLLNNIDDWKNAPVWTPKKISEATRTWFNYLKK